MFICRRKTSYMQAFYYSHFIISYKSVRPILKNQFFIVCFLKHFVNPKNVDYLARNFSMPKTVPNGHFVRDQI